MKCSKCEHEKSEHFTEMGCCVPGCHCAQYKPNTVSKTYIRNLEAVVSEAAYILSNLIEMDDTGLVFVTSADGKVLERAVAFLAAARSEE